MAKAAELSEKASVLEGTGLPKEPTKVAINGVKGHKVVVKAAEVCAQACDKERIEVTDDALEPWIQCEAKLEAILGDQMASKGCFREQITFSAEWAEFASKVRSHFQSYEHMTI